MIAINSPPQRICAHNYWKIYIHELNTLFIYNIKRRTILFVFALYIRRNIFENFEPPGENAIFCMSWSFLMNSWGPQIRWGLNCDLILANNILSGRDFFWMICGFHLRPVINKLLMTMSLCFWSRRKFFFKTSTSAKGSYLLPYLVMGLKCQFKPNFLLICSPPCCLSLTSASFLPSSMSSSASPLRCLERSVDLVCLVPQFPPYFCLGASILCPSIRLLPGFF